jgi:hypothetical protein
LRSLSTFALAPVIIACQGWHAASAQAPTRIETTPGASQDRFATSVATLGNVLIIGTPRSFAAPPAPGEVYIWERVGQVWTQTGELQPGTAGQIDQFGASVSVSRDFLVVGAPSDSQHSSGAGAAYVFRRSHSGWVQDAKLLPLNTNAQLFGSSVDIWDNTVVVGERSLPIGRALVFRRTAQGQWTYEATLLPTPGSGRQLWLRRCHRSGADRGRGAGQGCTSPHRYRSNLRLCFGRRGLGAGGVFPT